MTKSLPTRADIPLRYRWRLDTIYADDAAWEEEYRRVEERLPELSTFAGRLAEGAEVLLECLLTRDDIFLRVGKLYAYAHMRHDEDTTVARYQALYDRVISLYARCQSAASFLEPEIVALPEERLEAFLSADERLALYRRHLGEIRRQRAHVRSAEVEELLAELTEFGQGPYDIYHTLADADLKLPLVRDEHGEEVQLTQGRYLHFLQSFDRSVRREAFEAMLSTYRGFQNTLAAVYGTQVKANRFHARARRYSSALEMALDRAEIPTQVYHNLVETVRRYLPALTRYLELRRRVLGVEELHMYDLYVPIVPNPPASVPWERATELVTAALARLGDDYASEVREGLQSGWVDVFESLGKRSGAYSGGSYGTQPFILMNYDGRLEDVYTLAHEIGHSMHSLYTRRHQPFVYGDYTIFVAEVASTLNEALLSHHLLETTDDRGLKLYVLNHDLEHFRTTLYRQTLFAEFELKAHEMVEQGQPITAQALSELYLDINRAYYGDAAAVDELIAYEWGRIPHFYTSFYVYQYATGISAATALAQQILRDGGPAVERYRRFLTLGSSQPPLDLLRAAGVDMTSPEPIAQALEVFSARVDEMERLLDRGH